MSLLCYRAFRWAAGPVVARQAVVLAIVTALVYGLTDEVHQLFVPFRDSSWLDWLADTVGVGRITKTSASGCHQATAILLAGGEDGDAPFAFNDVLIPPFRQR